jgi:hypothetical protein
MRIKVEYESGVLGDVAPRHFRLGKRRIDVVEVIDRWPGGDRSYFKVADQDGHLYILRHDCQGADWELTMFANKSVLGPGAPERLSL